MQESRSVSGSPQLSGCAVLPPDHHADSACDKRFSSASSVHIPDRRRYGKHPSGNATSETSEPSSELLVQYLLQHLFIQTQIRDKFLQPLIFNIQLP